MRLSPPWLALLLPVAIACGEKDELDGMADAGNDAGEAVDAATSDAGSSDAGLPDAGDNGPYPCDPFHASAPTTSAPLTGRIEIDDYDYFDDIDLTRARVRNAGVNFRTQNLPPRPNVDAFLWTQVPMDGCVVFEMLAPSMPLGPARNIGSEITIRDEQGNLLVKMLRGADDMGMVEYDWATQTDLLAFFNPEVVAFDKRLTYATPGDATAHVRPASGTVEPFGDFTVQPAITATSAAVLLDPNGQAFTWTATTGTAQFSIVFSRALNPTGDGRYLLCRPIDDGSFTVPGTSITEFAAPAGSHFGVDVSRASFAGFCNEGVPVGAISHALVYLGLGRFD